MTDPDNTIEDWQRYLQLPARSTRRVELIGGPYDGGHFPYPRDESDPILGVPVIESQTKLAIYRMEPSGKRANFEGIRHRDELIAPKRFAPDQPGR